MTRPHSFAAVVCAVAFLAACDDAQSPPVASGALLPDSAEQMAFGIDFFLTDGGVRRAKIHADTLLVYEDGTREELFKVTGTFFTATGAQDAVMNAARGSHNNRLGTMEARGNVVIVSSKGEQLESPQLRYDPSRNEISSDSAFTLTQGERVTRGVGFVSNPDMSNMRILRAAQVTGSAVRIPKR